MIQLYLDSFAEEPIFGQKGYFLPVSFFDNIPDLQFSLLLSWSLVYQYLGSRVISIALPSLSLSPYKEFFISDIVFFTVAFLLGSFL